MAKWKWYKTNNSVRETKKSIKIWSMARKYCIDHTLHHFNVRKKENKIKKKGFVLYFCSLSLGEWQLWIEIFTWKWDIIFFSFFLFIHTLHPNKFTQFPNSLTFWPQWICNIRWPRNNFSSAMIICWHKKSKLRFSGGAQHQSICFHMIISCHLYPNGIFGQFLCSLFWCSLFNGFFPLLSIHTELCIWITSPLTVSWGILSSVCNCMIHIANEFILLFLCFTSVPMWLQWISFQTMTKLDFWHNDLSVHNSHNDEKIKKKIQNFRISHAN